MDPANFFLIVSLFVGIFYCIAIPYGAGFDEERHLVRIYYMSQYHFMPDFPNPTIHERVIDLSYQRRLVQAPAFDLFSRENFWSRFSAFEENIRYGQKTQSIYSPVIFLPQAMLGRLLWWKYDFPILPTIILQKIVGLSIYIAGCYMGIRAIPFGKWMLTALALSPAALFQAATLNADGFTNAMSFAFIGWVIAVYVNERSGVQPRSIWILIALSILLGVAKPGAIILLPLLLILLKHPFPSKKWVVLLAAGVLLAVIANVGWWVLASQGSVFAGAGSQSITQQSSLILAGPLAFIKPLVQSMILSLPYQIQGWMAAYGYWAGRVPGPVYFFSALFLLAAFLAEPYPVQIPAKTRIFLAGLFLLCSVVIYTAAFIPNYAIGGVLALAKHGRYYIPFAPLLFLGLTGLLNVSENVQKWARPVVLGSFVLATGWFTFGIYTTYYTYCGYDVYLGAKCSLPIYKNLEKEGGAVVGINNGERLSQTFTNQCGQLETAQVFIEAIPESVVGSLRFSLLDGGHQLLASRDFPAQEIRAGDYLSLPVDLPSAYQNKDFEIQLESIDLLPTEKFRLVVTPADYYPGLLSADGTTGIGDLLIHYICTGP